MQPSSFSNLKEAESKISGAKGGKLFEHADVRSLEVSSSMEIVSKSASRTEHFKEKPTNLQTE